MGRKENEKRKVTFGLKQKILGIAFIPLLVLAVASALFAAATIRKGMQDEALKRLEDIAQGASQVLGAVGDGTYRVEGESLYQRRF